ncbi:MAG: hypothetical protein K0Q93_1909 [Nocardioidaceae bacterium]|jgi:hypothetical protein|nr:hypothetical protein [Nocardioidaceae bacterium]
MALVWSGAGQRSDTPAAATTRAGNTACARPGVASTGSPVPLAISFNAAFSTSASASSRFKVEFSFSSSLSRLVSSAFHPAVLSAPPVQRLLGDLQVAADRCEALALTEQPDSLTELADNLLRSMSTSSHRGDPPSPTIVGYRVSSRADQPQGVTPPGLTSGGTRRRLTLAPSCHDGTGEHRGDTAEVARRCCSSAPLMPGAGISRASRQVSWSISPPLQPARFRPRLRVRHGEKGKHLDQRLTIVLPVDLWPTTCEPLQRRHEWLCASSTSLRVWRSAADWRAKIFSTSG